MANVRKMRKLVERLQWDPPQGVWTAYGERNTYTDDDARRKDDFVREVAGSRDWGLVWDIGANNGRYSRIAAEGARTVLAVDADEGPVELLYRDLRAEGDEQILTLTMNLADPSPGLGWRGLERRALAERGKPDLVLALALIHHVAISANVPVREFIDWLASLGSRARHRVPDARGSDGEEAARAQARGPPSRLRAQLLRALPGRGVRGRALGAPRVGHARPVPRPAEGRMSTAEASVEEPERGTERSLVKEAAWSYLNLAVLWCFAVAQPLFDLLKDNPEFFAARGSSGFDIVSFSVLLVVLPPLLLLGIELLVGPGRRRLRGARAHVVLIAGARGADRGPGAEEGDRRVGHRA